MSVNLYILLFVTESAFEFMTVTLYIFLFVTVSTFEFMTVTLYIFLFVTVSAFARMTVNLYFFLFVTEFAFGVMTVNLYIFTFVTGFFIWIIRILKHFSCELPKLPATFIIYRLVTGMFSSSFQATFSFFIPATGSFLRMHCNKQRRLDFPSVFVTDIFSQNPQFSLVDQIGIPVITGFSFHESFLTATYFLHLLHIP